MIDFVLRNSADPDEMPTFETLNLGIAVCLSTRLGVFESKTIKPSMKQENNLRLLDYYFM